MEQTNLSQTDKQSNFRLRKQSSHQHRQKQAKLPHSAFNSVIESIESAENKNYGDAKQPGNGKLRVIPLGGLSEVGRNMTLLEYDHKILIMDVGFRIPGEDMPGIDYIIPNIDYLKDKRKNIVGIVFTHGHYDHIGAVPYLIDKLWHPGLRIVASSLTRAIILKRQEDFPQLPKLDIETASDSSRFNFGPFGVEFFRQNHNIPENYGFFIETPVGNVVNTSDFKFDATPINEEPTDFNHLKALGQRGVLLLLSDSTDAEDPGHSLSEKDIFQNLETIFCRAADE